MSAIGRFIASLKERREAWRARRLATAHRRAAEGYDAPPLFKGTGPGGNGA